jgi:uncharacterized protein YdeI (YjbR/CyaY-like superfamily)
MRAKPTVDDFFAKAKKWQDEMNVLRTIVRASGLTEELKWYQPCYTYEGNNVVIISGFKDYCLLGFFKGALLKDPKGLLTRPGQHTQSGRQLRFTTTAEINKLKPLIKAYLQEAIEVEKAGSKVAYKKTDAYAVPEELQRKMKAVPAFQKAFHALTPGRQRGYLLYFAAAKQSKTREDRIEKHMPRIFEGKGLND